MLILLNKTQPETIGLVELFSGNEEKEVLLVGDAVFYGTDLMLDKFREVGVERVYALKDSVADRAAPISPECELVGYDEIVPLIMEEHEKIICL